MGLALLGFEVDEADICALLLVGGLLDGVPIHPGERSCTSSKATPRAGTREVMKVLRNCPEREETLGIAGGLGAKIGFGLEDLDTELVWSPEV